MTRKVDLTVIGITMDLSHTNIARITMNSDKSVIEIPYRKRDNKIIGLVPNDAQGQWATLKNKTCSFVEEPVPNWWNPQ